MLDAGAGEGEPLIEMYVETESDEEHQAATQVLAELDIEEVVRQTLRAVQVEQPVTLTLVISGDSGIQTLNKRYRQQDQATDVLSFPLLDTPLVRAPAAWLWQAPEGQEADAEGQPTRPPAFVTPGELALNLGDIVISWPTALHQARENGQPVAHELLFLLCHGLLHLLGYDDQTEAGYSAMVRQQQEILAPFLQQKG
jgi:probable rRNA maturation factor